MSASPPQFDERYVMEFFELGWRDLMRYLGKWARFEVWCRENDRA